MSKRISSITNPISECVYNLSVRIIAVLPAFYLYCSGNPVYGQNRQQLPPITFVHTPPTLNETVSPSSLIKLVVDLQGTKNFDKKLRAIMVKDGKQLDYTLAGGTLNIYDAPEYTFDVYAPLKEMSYQFVFTDSANRTFTSDRYTIKRNCLPKLGLNEEISSDEKTPEAVRLAQYARELEKQINAYDSVAKLIEEVLAEVNQQPK